MGGEMVKVEAVVVRERVETVIDAVEQLTGHVGVTVMEAGRPRPPARITDEYRGRVFESRFRLGTRWPHGQTGSAQPCGWPAVQVANAVPVWPG
jgi:hypothetical protein